MTSCLNLTLLAAIDGQLPAGGSAIAHLRFCVHAWQRTLDMQSVSSFVTGLLVLARQDISFKQCGVVIHKPEANHE